MTDPLVHVRAYPTTLEQIAPRQLTGLFVPFGVIADVVDELPEGRLDIYREGFRPGAFARQIATHEPGVIQKIQFHHAHDGGLGFLGPVVALREEPDGLHGDISVLRSKQADVEDLLDSGVRELSIEFHPRRAGTVIDADGVRWRTDVHLERVALEARGAYRGAEVLAMRAERDQADAEREAEEAAARASEEAAEQAAEATRQAFDDLDEWLAAEQARQDELRARYLS